MPKLIALLGCTASGKSDLALALAKKTNAHIISCDSLLVYRDMNIGTAKPTGEELRQAPHHLIDLVNANENFTAGDYVRFVRPILDDLVSRDIPAIIVGGTGFYLRALLYGIWDAPATDQEFRISAEAQSSENLFELLRLKDPEYAAKTDGHDRYRVIRALEIIHITGEPLSQRLAQAKPLNPLPYPCPVLGLRRSPAELEQRIKTRTQKMFAAGLVEEVKALKNKYPERPKSLKSIGYVETLAFLDGEMTLPECEERVFISTRQLAKKQRTFFNSFFKVPPHEVEWFDFPTQEEELFKRALGVLESD